MADGTRSGPTVTIRVRTLAAFVAAVASSVVGTVVVMNTLSAGAAPGDTDTTYVPIAPCRLFDYRPAPNQVGPRSAAIGPGEVVVQPVTGAHGNCVIPATATAVTMNVTAVNPTAQSNLRLFPADLVTPPLVSNLNFSPGQKPVANTVTVRLSPNGRIKLMNLAGSVNVVGDVSGYSTRSSLRALDASQPFAVSSSGDQALSIGFTTSGTTIRSVEVTAPVAGSVTLNYSLGAYDADPGHGVGCSVGTGTSYDPTHLTGWQSGGGDAGASSGTVAGTRTIAIPAGATRTFRLICYHYKSGTAPTGTPTSQIYDSALTAIFTPAP